MRRILPERSARGDLADGQRVAVGILDPGGAEAAGVEDAAVVGLDPGLVVALEAHPARRELVHGPVEVFDDPARLCRRRPAGVLGREVDEDAAALRAGIADALLLLLAGDEPQLVLIEAPGRLEMGDGQRRLDPVVVQSHACYDRGGRRNSSVWPVEPAQ